MPVSTTIPTGERLAGPSTDGPAAPAGQPQVSSPPRAREQALPQIGDIVLVKVDEQIRRPLLVTSVVRGLVSGTIFCEPGDQSLSAFRGQAEIQMRADRQFAYGAGLPTGMHIGQWVLRPTNSPAGR